MFRFQSLILKGQQVLNSHTIFARQVWVSQASIQQCRPSSSPLHGPSIHISVRTCHTYLVLLIAQFTSWCDKGRPLLPLKSELSQSGPLFSVWGICNLRVLSNRHLRGMLPSIEQRSEHQSLTRCFVCRWRRFKYVSLGWWGAYISAEHVLQYLNPARASKPAKGRKQEPEMPVWLNPFLHVAFLEACSGTSWISADDCGATCTGRTLT